MAALTGDVRGLRQLLDGGQDIEEHGQLGSPLRGACLMGHESCAALLLERGANANANPNHGSPLQAAASQGNLQIVELLLKNGAAVESHGGLFGTALQAAAYRGHLEVVKALLDAGAHVSREGIARDAFHAAIEGGHEETVRFFLATGFTYHYDVDVISCRYTRRGARNLLREASPSRKVDQDKQANSIPASSKREVVRYEGLDDVQNHVLTQAQTRDRLEKQPYREQRKLSKHGVYRWASRSAENMPHALETAAALGREAMVELLLENSDVLADYVSAQDARVALMEAAVRGHVNIVRLLLDGPYQLCCCMRQALYSLSLVAACETVELFLNYICRHNNDKLAGQRETDGLYLSQIPLEEV